MVYLRCLPLSHSTKDLFFWSRNEFIINVEEGNRKPSRSKDIAGDCLKPRGTFDESPHSSGYVAAVERDMALPLQVDASTAGSLGVFHGARRLFSLSVTKCSGLKIVVLCINLVSQLGPTGALKNVTLYSCPKAVIHYST